MCYLQFILNQMMTPNYMEVKAATIDQLYCYYESNFYFYHFTNAIATTITFATLFTITNHSTICHLAWFSIIYYHSHYRIAVTITNDNVVFLLTWFGILSNQRLCLRENLQKAMLFHWL